MINAYGSIPTNKYIYVKYVENFTLTKNKINFYT